MASTSVKLIFASTHKGVIGHLNKLPWSLPEDLQLFKEKTLNSTVLMGRNTFESLPASIKPLPNRLNVVVTSKDFIRHRDVKVITDPVEFIFGFKQPIWVMGGATLYNSVQHLADEVHHTEVYSDVEGDTHYHFDSTGWGLKEDSGVLTSRTGLDYRVRVWTVPLVLFRY